MKKGKVLKEILEGNKHALPAKEVDLRYLLQSNGEWTKSDCDVAIGEEAILLCKDYISFSNKFAPDLICVTEVSGEICLYLGDWNDGVY